MTSRDRPPDALMDELLDAALALARPPISGFAVGAVARGASGTLYVGANLEFVGTTLGASVHAEQAAVANAWAHGEPAITAIAATAAPCGHCRQFLCELGGDLTVLVRGAPPATLAALLPAAFGPADLGVASRLLGGSPRELTASDPAASNLIGAAALAAAGRSHAPYTGVFAGIALELDDGTIHTGASAESAAYNPSLPPLQTALACLAMRSIPFDRIVRAAVAETAGSISHRLTSEALLALVAPAARLTFIEAAHPPRPRTQAG